MTEIKSSGIDWIGNIPNNWNCQRLKYFIKEINEKNSKMQTTQVLSLTNKLGVIPYEEKGNQGNKAKDDYTEYKLAYNNTIIANSMNILIGSVGLSKYDGCVSPVYYVYKNTERSDIRFINYLFCTTPFQKELRKYAKGIMEIRLRVSSDDILKQIVPIPNIETQKIIANYLDKSCKEIDSVITKTKESLIDYIKLKQSIICNTLTKNKDTPMYKIGYLGQLKNGLNYNDSDPTRNIKMLGVGDFKDYLVLDKKEMFSDFPSMDEIPEDYLLKDEDLIFVRSNGSKDLVGRCVMVNNITYPVLYSGFCIRFRKNRKDLNSKYLLYFFRSELYREELRRLIFSTNINNLSQDILKSIKIPLPSFNEQNEITKYLDNKCTEIDTLITKKEQLITELETYKKSLIYEYITGKKEVK